MRGYLRPSLTAEAVDFDKDARERFPEKQKKRGGARDHSTKLTPDDVRWVRKNATRNGGDMTYQEMADKLHVGRSTVRAIIYGITWKEVE